MIDSTTQTSTITEEMAQLESLHSHAESLADKWRELCREAKYYDKYAVKTADAAFRQAMIAYSTAEVYMKKILNKLQTLTGDELVAYTWVEKAVNND